MNDGTLSNFYDHISNNYHARTNTLKLLLMPFVFFFFLGFPGKYGNYVLTYSSFVIQVFYILFGFFTLVPDLSKRNKKLKRGLRNAFKLFVIMFVSYIALSLVYMAYSHTLPSLLSDAFLRKRTFFDFLVLNVWPLQIGNSIWFVHSLIYAYLFFLFAEKIKINKLYLPILIILIILMLATGEFAEFFGFPHFGYFYIPAGAVTRAIPYMLIGMFLRKYVDKLTIIPRYVYLILFPVGLLAAVAEIELLGRIGKLTYVGHTIGFGVMALSLCCFALAKPEAKKNFLSNHGDSYSRRMYAFCQPVSFVLWLVTAFINPAFLGIVREFSGVISLIICFIIAWIIGVARLRRTQTSSLRSRLRSSLHKHQIRRRYNDRPRRYHRHRHRRHHSHRQ